MKADLLILLVVVAVGVRGSPSAPAVDRIRADSGSEDRLGLLREEFLGWMDLHQKNYETPAEFERRFQNFQASLREVEEHNRQKSSYKKGLNKFADLSNEEFAALFRIPSATHSWSGFFRSLKLRATRFLGSFLPQPEAEEAPRLASRSYAELSTQKIDWEALGALNPIRDQRLCGSCAIFGTVAAVEAAYGIKHGRRILLSEQHMLNCIGNGEFDSLGCMGTLPGASEAYLVKYGLQLQDDYPYFGEVRPCKRDKEPAVRVKEVNRKITNTIELLEEIIKGPVTVHIDFNMEFRLYSSGVLDFKFPCGHQPNHMVTAVGFDLTADPPFVKIRNSHGLALGNQGYFNLALAGPEDAGFCALTFHSFRPILAD